MESNPLQEQLIRERAMANSAFAIMVDTIDTLRDSLAFYSDLEQRNERAATQVRARMESFTSKAVQFSALGYDSEAAHCRQLANVELQILKALGHTQ